MCKRSLILALGAVKSGAEAALNSKSKSKPPLGSTAVVVRMPGLFPGEIVPVPAMVGTMPVPESTAGEPRTRAEELAMLPVTCRLPECAQVAPV